MLSSAELNVIYRKDIDTYEESHPIIGVGLVKPKRDIFNPDITHVLVIATTLHINVVAISFKRSPSGATQLTFYRTDMFTSTSGEIISTIIGTKQGRIFMLSKQGRVWELDYRVSVYFPPRMNDSHWIDARVFPF